MCYSIYLVGAISQTHRMALKHQVGIRIRSLRDAAGLKQGPLAELIGKSSPAVSDIERGVYAPNFETIEAISKALDVPPSLMFPPIVSGRRETAKDKLLSELMANAARLTKEDVETVLALAINLNKRAG